MAHTSNVVRRILQFVLMAAVARVEGNAAGANLFVDCSQSFSGDGSLAHPWNSLAAAETHRLVAGDRIALARGTVCHGTFSPQGSGVDGHPIRLTAYGQGPRPRIVATAKDRQVLLLFNQEYWLVDSLDLSGANTFGIYVTGDKGTLHHIRLENLFVHDVQGGAMKNKDNGLVVVGPSSANVIFNDVLVDGVVAAHTNQWAGILIGGGPFPYAPDAPLNSGVTVRNSSIQDVYGDGIVLFRDSSGVIETSTAWQTGMQPTQTIGTPNAIWTWTCSDCTVRDNEAFLTDSPGVDGGAYDIDWDNTRNTVERNYAHDTQGYCIAVFAAGYITSQSVVRDNLCIDNAMSPRLAALQGAFYVYTWNDGVIRDLRIEHNTLVFSPPVATAAALVIDAKMGDTPASFTDNTIESSAPLFYRVNAPFSPAHNTYLYRGVSEPRFTVGSRRETPFAALQAAGLERGTTLVDAKSPKESTTFLRLDAAVDLSLDADGLLASSSRAQLMVLRSLAAQYGPPALAVTVHLRTAENASQETKSAEANALLDLDAGSIKFEYDGKQASVIRLLDADGGQLEEWRGFQNAATLGRALRARLGRPQFALMFQSSHGEGRQ